MNQLPKNIYAKAVCLLVVALALILALSFGLSLQAHAAPPDEPDDPGQATSYDPASCAKCHAEEYTAWQEGPHAHAFTTPSFQVAWNRTGKLTSCLPCHTTGYDEETKQVEAAGVTCASCHPSAGQEHPSEVLPMPVSSETCGECHEDALQEWEISGHGQNDVECTACHEQHTDALRKEPADALCVSCHQDQQMENVSLGESALESMSCTTCHMPEDPAQEHISPAGGFAAISHTFDVSSQSCSECHQDAAHGPGHSVLSNGSTGSRGNPRDENPESQAVTVAQERVRILESKNQALERQVESHRNATLFGSGFAFGIGSFVGLIGTLVIGYMLQRKSIV